jgi:hypothetical protein
MRRAVYAANTRAKPSAAAVRLFARFPDKATDQPQDTERRNTESLNDIAMQILFKSVFIPAAVQ